MKYRFFCVILTILFANTLLAQQIHVRYRYVRSPVATLYEDLYIKDGKVISIQDSLLSTPPKTLGTGWYSSISVTPKSYKDMTNIVPKMYFISKLGQSEAKREISFTSNKQSMFDNEILFVHDEIEAPKWVIDYNSTRKIAGYETIKATTNFRGSDITAYFAKDLPYSTGPFKFFGLPGLILDVRVDGLNYFIWKAVLVEEDNHTNVDYNPKFKDYKKVSMKELVKINDGLNSDFKKKTQSILPAGTKITQEDNGRVGVEKKFEWEE